MLGKKKKFSIKPLSNMQLIQYAEQFEIPNFTVVFIKNYLLRKIKN